MPRRRSSIMMNKVNKKKHLRNFKVKKDLKKKIKELNSASGAKSKEDAKKLLQQVYSKLDKAAKKRIIHPATANRKKSRLARKLLKAA